MAKFEVAKRSRRGRGLWQPDRRRGGVSMRARITGSLLLVFLALGPAVIFSLYYLDRVLSLTHRVTRHDVAIVTTADDLAKQVLQTRSELRSLVIDSDIMHLRRLQETTASFPPLLGRLSELFGPENNSVRQLDELLKEYSARVDTLATLAVQTHARSLVDSRHYQRVDDVTSMVLERIEGLATEGDEALASGRERIEIFTMRARRNLLTLILATALLELVLIVILPRMIVRPLRRLHRMVRQVEHGRFDLRVDVSTDEIGELGLSINRLLEQFEQIDSLKLDKISELASRFRAVSGLMEVGVLVLDTELKPVHANRCLLERLGTEESLIRGLDLQRLFDDESIVHLVTSTILDPVHDRFETRLRTTVGPLPVEVICRGAHDRKGDIANLVLLVQDRVAATSPPPPARKSEARGA